jgi:hypothetical protein
MQADSISSGAKETGLMPRFSMFSLCLLSLVSPAAAAEGCGPDRLERGTLAQVSADGDLRLADGRSLRLAGLHRPGDGDRPAALPVKAGDTLAFGLLDEADRWSRLPAIVFALPDGGDPVWLQEHLAATGRALVRWEAALGGCWPLLAAAEARAQALPRLAAEVGRFARVEGRVSRIGEGRSAHFVTLFDADGQRVTGLVQKRHLKRLKDAGVDVAGLKGHIVRIRGVRGPRNPQVIAVSRAEQIEIVR